MVKASAELEIHYPASVVPKSSLATSYEPSESFPKRSLDHLLHDVLALWPPGAALCLRLAHSRGQHPVR